LLAKAKEPKKGSPSIFLTIFDYVCFGKAANSAFGYRQSSPFFYV